jgi:pimeloyl-ACP methyl ester carboxylesterase
MYIQTSEGRIYFEVHGDGSRPSLVFTHGAGLHCRMFDSQLEAFRDKYRIILWDMPGHGRSGRLNRSLDFSAQSEHICQILDELGIPQAVLAGHSLGSWVSQYTAARYPERVKAIVSLGGTPLHRSLGRSFQLVFMATNWVFRLVPAGPVFSYVARQKALTEGARQFYLDSLMELGSTQVFFINQGMATGAGITIARPQQPVLISHGEFEKPDFTVRLNRQWHAEDLDSVYAEIPAAGHNANQDNPDAFNAALSAFLAKVYI